LLYGLQAGAVPGLLLPLLPLLFELKGLEEGLFGDSAVIEAGQVLIVLC
jgi:hypothetical protein